MSARAAKIVLWALVLPLGLASALIAALWLYAGGDGGRALLLRLWQDQARQSLGAELTVEELAGNPLTSLRARGIRLEREGRTLASVAEMELNHNPLALLGGRLRLGHLRLTRPELSLPLPPAPAAGGGTGLALTISELEIQGGRLTAGGGLGPLTAVEGLDLTGALAADSRGLLVEAQLTKASLVLAGAARPLAATGRVEVTGQGLNVKNLRLDDGANALEASGDLNWVKAPRFSLSLRGQVAKAGELPWPWPGPRAPSLPLSLQTSLRGDLERAELRASLGQGGEAGPLELSGELAWQARRLTAQGRLAGLDLASLGLTPWPASLGGVMGLELAVAEDWTQFKRARLDLELDQVHLAGQAPARASLSASWEPGTLKVSSLNLHAPWGALEGSGQAAWAGPLGQPPEISATVGFNDLTWPTGIAPEPPAWLAPLAAQARLRGRAEAKGRPTDLAWHLDLERSQVAPGLELARLAVRGGLRNTQWRVESLDLQGEGLELSARGSATAGGAEAEFSLKVAQLARLADPLRAAGLALPSPLAGEVSAQGRIKGPWEAPGLSLKAQLREVDLPGFGAGQAELLLESGRLGLPATGQVKLTLLKHRQGDWYFERAQLEGQAGPGGINLAASAQGPDLKAGLRLSGPASPTLPLGLRLEGLSLALAGRPAWQQAGRASLTLTAQALAVQDLALTQGDQRLSLEGSLGQGGAVSGGLGLSRLRLGPWLPVRGLARGGPMLEAQAKLGGSLAAPRLELTGRLTDLAWANLPSSEATLSGLYADGLLAVRGRALTLGVASLELDAELGLDLGLVPPRLKTNPRGLRAGLMARDLPVALLEPVLPVVSELGGRLELEIQAEGSLEAPRLQGHLALKQGAFTVNATSQAFRDINLRLGLKGRELTVEQFQLASGGPVRLTGRVELPLGGPGLADLDLTATGFHVSLANLGEVVTDARLKLHGPTDAPRLTGLLTPRRAVIQPRMATPDIQRDVVILKPGQKPPPVRREIRRAPRIQLEGLLAPLVMDVDLEMTPELKIKVGEGFLEMIGVASVRKAPGGPLTYHGGSRVPRGAIVVQGKRFEISEGSTDLRGKDRADPDLSAKATLRLGTSLVLASVSGTAYETLIDLSSEPPMSQADILSTIIFGRPASALNAGETRQLSAQALALMGERGRREIEKFLGPALSPDVVTVHNEIQSGSSLEAGKYLSPDLYLRYRQNMGQEGGQNVGLELRLKPYISLESQLGTTRDNGVDVIFSFDFD